MSRASRWKRVQLGEICTVGGLKTGPFGSQLHASEYAETGVPVIMPRDLRDSRVRHDSPARVPVTIAARLKDHALLDGDLVFARRGDIGRFALIGENETGWLCGTGCIRARLDRTAARPGFVATLLEHNAAIAWLRKNAVGQTMLNLSARTVAALPLMLPSIEVQRQIEDVVKLFGERISGLGRLIQAKHRFQIALSKQLFAGRVRFRAFAESQWNVTRLRAITRESRETNRNVLDASRVMGVSKTDGIIPMRDRTIGPDLRRYKVLHPRSFAYNPMRINIGSIARWAGDSDVLVSPDYVVFQPITEVLDDRFLDHYRRSELWERYMQTAGSGSVRVRIYYDDLAAMILELPGLEEQRHIAGALDALDREIALLERQRDLLERQKRAVTDRLITGEVHLHAKT